MEEGRGGQEVNISGEEQSVRRGEERKVWRGRAEEPFPGRQGMREADPAPHPERAPPHPSPQQFLPLTALSFLQ